MAGPGWFGPAIRDRRRVFGLNHLLVSGQDHVDNLHTNKTTANVVMFLLSGCRDVELGWRRGASLEGDPISSKFNPVSIEKQRGL